MDEMTYRQRMVEQATEQTRIMHVQAKALSDIAEVFSSLGMLAVALVKAAIPSRGLDD